MKYHNLLFFVFRFLRHKSARSQEGNSLDENAISDQMQHCSLTIDSLNHSGSESSSAGNESNGTSNDQQALCQSGVGIVNNIKGQSTMHGKGTLKLCSTLNNNNNAHHHHHHHHSMHGHAHPHHQHQIVVNNATGMSMAGDAVVGSQFPGQLITSKSSVSGASSNFLEHSEISCKNSRNTLYIGPNGQLNASSTFIPNLHLVSNMMNLETTEL